MSQAPSPSSSSWFTVPTDYKYPAWHVALVALLTTSAAVGVVATACVARRHCHLAGTAGPAAATVAKRDRSCGNGSRADKESDAVEVATSKQRLQGWAKERSLGCVNSAS